MDNILIASFVTYPHVVVRTIMHDDRRHAEHLNLGSVLKKIYGQFGLRGFYLGLKPDLIRILPSNSIVFMVYELLKKYIM